MAEEDVSGSGVDEVADLKKLDSKIEGVYWLTGVDHETVGEFH